MWGPRSNQGQPRAVYTPSQKVNRTTGNQTPKKDYTFKSLPNVEPTEERETTLYTAGYGGHGSADKFADALKSNGVTVLVDIRISPYSSYSADFNPDNLAKALNNKEIEYQHMIELGNVFKGSSAEDPVLGPSPYNDLLTGAGEVLTRRLRHLLGKASGVCIMCACKDFRTCHRNSVAGFLEAKYNCTVLHIGPGGTKQPSRK